MLYFDTQMGKETSIDELIVKGEHRVMRINQVCHVIRQFVRNPLGQVRVPLPYPDREDATFILASLSPGNLNGYFQSPEQLNKLFIVRNGIPTANTDRTPESPKIAAALQAIKGTTLDVFAIGGLYLPNGLRSYDFVLTGEKARLRLRVINDPNPENETVYLSYVEDTEVERTVTQLTKLRREPHVWQYLVVTPGRRLESDEEI